MYDSVPVIDFSAYSLDRSEPDPVRFQQLVDEVYMALTTIGFMYLKNFGIPAETIKDAFSNSKKFFYQPTEVKLKYASEDQDHGYMEIERSGLNPERKFKDLKESFDYHPKYEDQPFPDEEVPDFQSAMKTLFRATIPLHNRVLEVIARGLKLEDPLYFVKRHQLQGGKYSSTALRTLYYPAVATLEVKEDQVRCGEHTDYGGITLLYQDKQAGLEVRNVNNEWIAAPPIDGAVIINIGSLMQRWTADKLIASKHRVMIPVDQILRQQERQSIVFFGLPDDETVVECIDKSNKYPPVKSLDYLNMRINETF